MEKIDLYFKFSFEEFNKLTEGNSLKFRVAINKLLASYHFRYMSPMYEGEEREQLYGIVCAVERQTVADLEVIIK